MVRSVQNHIEIILIRWSRDISGGCQKTKFDINIIFDPPVDQAGSERTEAGESAPSRLEESPRPGRAKCELCETLQDLIMGAGEEASLNLPCLLILASS